MGKASLDSARICIRGYYRREFRVPPSPLPLRVLDIERILHTTFVASAEYHDRVTSTNDLAVEIAGRGKPRTPLLVVAGEQAAGRGQGVKRWWSGPGSLAFTLLLDPGPASADGQAHPLDAPQPAPSPMLALAAGVAVVEALAPLAGTATVGLRWPNDVMAAGRKLAGILVEVLARGRVVMGIGVNTNNTAQDAPAEIQARVGTLRDLTGRTHDQTDVLAAILLGLERSLALLGRAPAELAARADALCVDHGRPLRVACPAEALTGRCLGVAADGALLLETAAGCRAIYSGSVAP
jgi:BirA family biotin operon repressor/biotin-[acetyl-CoA-carboxylase] ligase